MGSSTSRNDRNDEEEIREKDAIDLAEQGLSDARLDQLQVAAIKCLKERDLKVRWPHFAIASGYYWSRLETDQAYGVDSNRKEDSRKEETKARATEPVRLPRSKCPEIVVRTGDL